MFGVQGEDFFSSWISFILLAVLVVVGILIFKFISDYINTYFQNNKKSKDKANKMIDAVYGMPRPLKITLKVISTVIYLAICLIIIGYASS